MDILIVDDELLARERLARMVEKIEGFCVVAEADNADHALRAITEYDPDIVLLDVRMPGKNGLSLAQDISTLEDAPAVIFCTAYDQYALEAFSTEAIGYLLKPVKAEHLLNVLHQAQKLNKIQLAAVQDKAQDLAKAERSHISAKTRRGVELIALEHVRYFLADHKYVTVYHLDGEHLLDETLKELEEEFSGRFLRIHRNALVAIKYIEAIERVPGGQYQVRLAGTEHKPVVSRRHVGSIKNFLKSL